MQPNFNSYLTNYFLADILRLIYFAITSKLEQHVDYALTFRFTVYMLSITSTIFVISIVALNSETSKS
ncbi:hypothetical protein C3B55_00740 [Candidatus Pseudomonas adelgestsugas]|uniref:Uncharacterized protein n=1 Tax=Candidatus Pseudomonas adelgestsugas TaxID=1302376 RepID=A0ABX5R8U0_9PSED|nr:hypothetical protein C3B55_00740 [Candidatus Pseudomonas adelgestsugas]